MLENLRRKLIKLWDNIIILFAYLVSIILPIIASNTEKLLKPTLESLGFPNFITSDFTVYAVVFGVCGVITATATKKLLIRNSPESKALIDKNRELQRQLRGMKSKNKQLTQKENELINQISQNKQVAISDCQEKIDTHRVTLEEQHGVILDRVTCDYEREICQLKERVRIQDVALKAMQDYKSMNEGLARYNQDQERKNYRDN